MSIDQTIEETIDIVEEITFEAIRYTSETLDFTEDIVFENIREFPIYGTVDEADRYFAVLLHGEIWERCTPIRKYKALVSATSNINKLRFAGRKTNATQALEYPRNGDTVVPLAVRQATYEEAMALLKGIDVVTEYDNLFVKSRGMKPLVTDYDTGVVPEYKKHGIASLRAWNFILPYLLPNLDLRIRRES